MKKRIPVLFLAVALLLLAALATGGTLAYLKTVGDPVANDFTSAWVTSSVNWQGETATVTNTGNVKAYVRAAIAVNWAKGETDVHGVAPTDSDYSLTLNTEDWEPIDGYYYYKHPVEEGAATAPLITAVTQTGTAPAEGYVLSVELAAEAIQAEGMNASSPREAWQNAIA